MIIDLAAERKVFFRVSVCHENHRRVAIELSTENRCLVTTDQLGREKRFLLRTAALVMALAGEWERLVTMDLNNER